MSSTTSLTGISYIKNNIKYPSYIKDHQIFSNLTKINKVFPRLGLPNSEEECDFSLLDDVKNEAINLITVDIRNEISKVFGCIVSSNPLYDLLCGFLDAIVNNYNNCIIVDPDNKISLKSFKPILIGKEIFSQKGESVFKVYNKIVDECAKSNIHLKPLDQMPWFKAFSRSNIPTNKCKIVFSSTGEQGAWDIATMSMRGISSCQSWNTSQSYGLIGSIASCFVGVIYLTSGIQFNEFGSKMIRRAVVRYCINRTTKEPALVVDRIYPAHDNLAVQAFKKYLQNKTKLKVIFTATDNEWSSYELPVDKFYQKVKFQPNEYTYMDSKMLYRQKATPDYTRYCAALQTLDAYNIKNISDVVFSYIRNPEPHKDLLKDGFGNLLIHLGSCVSPFNGVPRATPLFANSPEYLKPSKFSSIPQYERAVIKYLLLNASGDKLQNSINSTLTYELGKDAIKSYPNSIKTLSRTIVSEYKKMLLKRFKEIKY